MINRLIWNTVSLSALVLISTASAGELKCRELHRAADETILSLAFFNDTTGLAGSWGGGLFRTSDGGTSWRKTDVALGLDWVSGIAALPSGRAVAVTSGGAALVTADEGATWTRTDFPGLSLTAVALDKSLTGWAVGVGGAILRTADGGQTWEPLASPVTKTLFAVSAPDPLTMLAVGENGTIVRTGDSGTSWKQLAAQTEHPLFSVWFADSQTGWVGGRGGTLLATKDGGETFAASALSPALEIDAITFVTPLRGWAAGGNSDGSPQLMKTEDGGAAWTTIDTGLARNWWHALSAVPARVIAGGTRGVIIECRQD